MEEPPWVMSSSAGAGTGGTSAGLRGRSGGEKSFMGHVLKASAG
jgi:hypothetical protein